ncbi:hypothetical protein ANN_17315 [Periplaneta americana]|uniref:Odorant receptor n=1 Tax=Periplaneta americana TaxID=6978 RepID=A0ABQ8STW3_PERAM|nr:hypothetical protein ANN_17315 [Periplaneta americana]
METANDKERRNRRFWITIILLKIAGIPIHVKQLSVFQLIYDAFVSISTYSVFIASLVDVWLNSDDLKRSMGTIRLIFVMAMILLGEINFRFHKDTLRRLFLLTESFTWEDLPLTEPDTGGLTAAGLMPSIDDIFKKYIPVTVGIHLVQTTIRILTNRDMMFNGWYPFDASLSPNYEIVILSQFLAMVRFFALFYACPHLYVTTVCIACTQLKKLKMYMSEIKQQITSKTKSSENFNNQDYKCRMERQLKDFILHHQQIIKYIHTLDELTGMWLGGVFLCALLSLCTAAFSAVMDQQRASLSMNPEKTKLTTNASEDRIHLNGQPLEYVEDYIYLGQNLSFSRNSEKEIKRRISMAWKKFWSLKFILTDKFQKLSLKVETLEKCILPVLLYGCQTWSLTSKQRRTLQTCQRSMERKILQLSLKNKVRNEELRNRTDMKDVINTAKRLKWKWGGQVVRMDHRRWTHRVTLWDPRTGRRRVGRQTTRWADSSRRRQDHIGRAIQETDSYGEI